MPTAHAKTNLRLPVHRPCKPGGVPQRRSSQGQHPSKAESTTSNCQAVREILARKRLGDLTASRLQPRPKISLRPRVLWLRSAARTLAKLRGRGSEAPPGQAHRPRREAIPKSITSAIFQDTIAQSIPHSKTRAEQNGTAHVARAVH